MKLPLDEILYITTSSVPHLLHVVTRDDVYQTYNQLQVLEKLLAMEFHRCHRKYLVNIDSIERLNKMSRTISFFESEVRILAILGESKKNWKHCGKVC